MTVGAQLYTVRDYCQTERDIARSLERVAAIGYKTVQVSGAAKINPSRLRELCDKNGLKIVLTHIDPARIINDTAEVIREHDILGCDYIGIGGMPPKYRAADWIDMFAEDFLPAAKEFAAAGKLFMYHNHAFEFSRLNGKLIIDYLLEAFTPSEMGFTLDTYWVHAAGADVCKWIKKLSGRLPVVHLKDMSANGNTSVMMPVGGGNLDFEEILKAFSDAGTKYAMVEQDTCEGSPFECLRFSYETLKKLGAE